MSNLEITAALMAPFTEEEYEGRKGRGRDGFIYVAGENVIRRAISATDNCFDLDFDDLQCRSYPDRKNTKTGELVHRQLWTARVAVTIPGLGTRKALGVQVVDEDSGEDLIKGVVTDGFKKALTYFGTGLELYDDPAPGNQRGGGGQSSDASNVAEWRKRVKAAAETNDRTAWKSLIADAGKEPWRWVEMAGQISSLDQLERFAQVASEHDALTAALETKLLSRKREIEKAATS